MIYSFEYVTSPKLIILALSYNTRSCESLRKRKSQWFRSMLKSLLLLFSSFFGLISGKIANNCKNKPKLLKLKQKSLGGLQNQRRYHKMALLFFICCCIYLCFVLLYSSFIFLRLCATSLGSPVLNFNRYICQVIPNG